MPPQKFPEQPPMTGIDWDQHPIGTRPGEPGFDPNAGFNQILYPGGQLPPNWQPNTGGMNPNQPWQGGGEGSGGWTGHAQDPNFGQLGTIGAGPYSNRGSGQPLSQPMGGYQAPGMATWTPAAGVPNGWQAGGIENPFGASGQQPLGSLQSLGGSIPGSPPMAANAGDWNGQGTMGGGFVSLRGPDGSMKQVPADQLSHWLSRGAVRA
jgi:hypothetical protein